MQVSGETIYQWIYQDAATSEPKCRFLVAAMLDDRSATSFSQGTQQVFADVPERLCKTLTLDNGTENTLHHEITKAKGMKVFLQILMPPGNAVPMNRRMVYYHVTSKRN